MNTQTQNPNQKQALESSKANEGRWYVDSTGDDRVKLIKQCALSRGWKFTNGAISFYGYVGKLRADAYRYFEIFLNDNLVLDADFRGLCPEQVATMLDGVETRIKALLTPKIFDVSVSRDTSENTVIRINALTADEAREIARDEGENNDALEWEQSDFIGNVQVDLVSEVVNLSADETVEIFNAGNEPKTNLDLITEIMTFSRYGALSQAFVIDALTKHANRVAEATAEELAPMQNGLVSAEAWQGVAIEIKTALEAFYKGA